jgi:hypothetical protein
VLTIKTIIPFVIGLDFVQGSTSIIDTSMFGQIDIENTLEPAGVSGLGASPVAAALTQVTAANSEIGTTKISIRTSSLEMLIFAFMV